MDCFAEPVIGRRFAPTRWLAMTNLKFKSENALAMTPLGTTRPRRLKVEGQWISDLAGSPAM
jgi:hypothetical protein